MRFIYQFQQPTKTFLGINPMVLGAPWCPLVQIGAPWPNTYLEHQQKEQYYVSFIYQYSVTKFSNCPEANQCIYDNRRNKKPGPSPQPPTKLQGKKIHMSVLDTSH